MITMTFDEYDRIYEELLEKDIGEDFVYPDISYIPHLLTTDEGFRTVILAYLNTTDKNYRNEVNKILSQLLELTEESANRKSSKAKITQEQHKKIIETIEKMDFQLYGYFPDMEEIKRLVKEPTEINIAFLYWLLNTPEELITSEQKTQADIRLYIAQLTA